MGLEKREFLSVRLRMCAFASVGNTHVKSARLNRDLLHRVGVEASRFGPGR